MQNVPKEIFLKDYQVPDFLIDTVDLSFDIYEDHTIVKNVSCFCRNPNAIGKNGLKLNGINLELLFVSLNDRPLEVGAYTKNETGIEIKNVPDEFTLKTEVKIFPHLNLELSGLYKSDNIFCTQNEPEGFRRITYHLDRPDVMSRFRTKISADKQKYPVLLSNGNCVDSGMMANNRHFVVWEDPFKKPNYLFALVAGDLVAKEDFFITQSGKKVTLQIFTERKDMHRVDHAMESLKKAMKWDEERFGREYDLDIYMIVAVDAFNSGAMENKGLNIFNTSAILCDPESSTDADYKYIERVIAHEYFHNWTGNRITCRDWFQLTLKEGLTVFRDAEFSADIGDRAVKRIDDAAYMREIQFPEDASPMAHPIKPASFIQIENFYTRTVYEKGAEVIRMLLCFLGREGFRKGMDKYFELFDGQAVTTEDFISAFEIASGKDFSIFKESWYAQAGTPVLEFLETYDTDQKKYTLTIKQACPYPENPNLKPFHFPLKFGLLLPDGSEVVSEVLEIKKFEETFVFENIPQCPVPSILRDFSAPVKIKTELLPETDLFLFAHDTDPFNRYEAGQRIARRKIIELMQNIDEKIPCAVWETYRSILKDENLGKSFRAQCLSFPGIYSILEPFKVHEYLLAHQARKKYAQILADFLELDLLEIYHRLNVSVPYSKDEASMSRRSLKNACLSYLSYTTKNHTNLIYQQFEGADNMTDKLAALSLLCHQETPEKEKALTTFYDTWNHDPLVMNKWFAVQARATSASVLENVKKLEKNPAFDHKNPNKIRALFGAFGRNLPFFHDVSGNGYQYIAEKIIEIDQFNAKAAGSLVRVFDDLPFLGTEQAHLAKSALDRVLSTPKISDVLFEVVHKIRNA